MLRKKCSLPQKSVCTGEVTVSRSFASGLVMFRIGRQLRLVARRRFDVVVGRPVFILEQA